MEPMRPKAVLLDMGGVILRMAGGHGFPQTRLDFRGRQAMLQALGRAAAEPVAELADDHHTIGEHGDARDGRDLCVELGCDELPSSTGIRPDRRRTLVDPHLGYVQVLPRR